MILSFTHFFLKMVHFLYPYLHLYQYRWKVLKKNHFYLCYLFVVKQKICCFFNSFFYSYQLKGIDLARPSYCHFWLIPKSKSSQKLLVKKYPCKVIAKNESSQNFFLCESKTLLKIWNFLVSEKKYLKNLRKLVPASYSLFFWFYKNQPLPKLTPLRFLNIYSISIQS